MSKRYMQKCLILAISLISVSTYADNSTFGGISSNDQALIDALKSCAEGAISQGTNTYTAIVSHCSQEKADLDAAISESMSEYVINSALG